MKENAEMEELPRKYNSPLREQQANETRERILAAAKKILLSDGYARTTIEAIAREAGVSPQTIYATLKNKRNIFVALMEKSVKMEVDAQYRKPLEAKNIHECLRRVANVVIACNIRVKDEEQLLRAAGMVSPELAKVQKVCAEKGRLLQREHYRKILEKVRLRPRLSLEKALDIFCYLTRHDSYRTLVEECGWTHEEYGLWLYKMLGALLADDEQ